MLAYWYFYTHYDQLGSEDPWGFLINRLRRVVKSIEANFRPNKYSGAVRPFLKEPDQLGKGIELKWDAPNGISADELAQALERAGDAIREEGRPILATLYVAGATRIAFPGDRTVVEDFVSSRNPGPWRLSGSWDSYFGWLDEIIHLSAGDFRRSMHIAVKTNSPIWFHEWAGVDGIVAREVAETNRARLGDILRSVRTVLPEAKLDHHSEGPVSSTEDGFSL